jgi:hypothetical protein
MARTNRDMIVADRARTSIFPSIIGKLGDVLRVNIDGPGCVNGSSRQSNEGARS